LNDESFLDEGDLRDRAFPSKQSKVVEEEPEERRKCHFGNSRVSSWRPSSVSWSTSVDEFTALFFLVFSCFSGSSSSFGESNLTNDSSVHIRDRGSNHAEEFRAETETLFQAVQLTSNIILT